MSLFILSNLVFQAVNVTALELKGGQAMSWIVMEGLQSIQLTPCVYVKRPKIDIFQNSFIPTIAPAYGAVRS